MTASALPAVSHFHSLSNTALNAAARFWFTVAVLGQWMFVAYVAIFYGGAAMHGNLESWNKVLPRGYAAGDWMHNIVVGAHLLLAVIIMIGGPLQLIPQIRRHALAFHRWNGRFYAPAVFLTSIAGLYMAWGPGTIGGLVQHLGISLDAVLIMIFSVLSVYYAMKRKLDVHRRWALRLFMVVNGVWFFRVGLMLWLTIHGGPVGFDPKAWRGPFLDILSFADYLLPLAVLELYLRTKDHAGTPARFAMAGLLFVLTLAMAVGIFAATMGMWLPRIS